MKKFGSIILTIIFALPVLAQDEQWIPVTGADKLRNYMSGATAERTLPDGKISKGEYFADGTGVVYEYGGSFPRIWQIKGQDQICISASAARAQACFTLEQNSAEPNLYRGRIVATGNVFEFRAAGGIAVATATDSAPSQGGSVATASVSEIAAELSNPNTTLGTMNTNFDYLWYDGDLDGANDQSAFKMTFQPSLPYPITDTVNFFIRPAIPIIFKQDVPSSNGDFDSKGVDLGDIGFDAAFGKSFKQEGGVNVVLAGMAGTLPTATDDALGLDQWLLGPELGGFIVRKWGVLGIIASHQWDVAGEDDFDTSLTGGQYIYSFNLKDGWQVFSGPTWSYNHEADSDDAWTLPLGIGIAKTIIAGGRPWKLSAQYWNYVKSPDAFGPEHQIRFTIGPVVKLPWEGRK